MKIAIISDTHDNIYTLRQALSFINKEKIDVIIHCGDVTRVDTLKEIIDNFKKRVYLVSASPDDEYLKTVKVVDKHVHICGKVGGFTVDNVKIGFTHLPKDAHKLAKNNQFDIIFYGHTHKPWEEMVNKCKLVNPGNLAGIFYKATFAIFDTKTANLALKMVENLNN
jgi:putative phosphoesterase